MVCYENTTFRACWGDNMQGGRFFIGVALVALVAGGGASARAAGVSSLTQGQAALYLGCVGAISAPTLSGGQPVTSTTLASQYKSLSQLTSLTVVQFAVLEDRALRSYGCSLCLGDKPKRWISDALKQFSGLGSASTFTSAQCLSTAAGFTGPLDGTCTCP